MTKKKSPTPVKKDAEYAQRLAKDMAFVNLKIPPYLETLINKYGSVIPKGMVPADAIQPPSLPKFEMLLGEMDKQISRYYNSLNSLFAIADSLGADTLTVDGTSGQEQVLPKDYIGRLDTLIGTFNRENNRIEDLVSNLQKVV